MTRATKVPHTIKLLRQSRCLELSYADDERYELSCEYLRVHSPSAEVRGHGSGQEVLQTGKRYVSISNMETSGNYALKIDFDDGHDTGIYSWDYLYALCQQRERNWQDYLRRLDKAGASREPQGPVIIARERT